MKTLGLTICISLVGFKNVRAEKMPFKLLRDCKKLLRFTCTLALGVEEEGFPVPVQMKPCLCD